QVGPEEPAGAIVGGGRIVARADRERGGARKAAAVVGGDADTVLRGDGQLAWVLIIERQVWLNGKAGRRPYRSERRVGPAARHCIRCRRELHRQQRAWFEILDARPPASALYPAVSRQAVA